MPSRGQKPNPEDSCHRGAHGGPKERTRAPIYYPSNTADAPIVHAMTGEPLGFKVGSAAALTLFRVTDSSGRCDEEGYPIRRKDVGADASLGKTPNKLYYHTPAEYSEHNGGAALPPGVEDHWRARSEKVEAAHADAQAAHAEGTQEPEGKTLPLTRRGMTAIPCSS